MPKGHKLTKEDIEFFKQLLLKLRKKIVSGLQHIEQESLNTNPKEASGDLSGYGFHMADSATENFDTEVRLGMVSSEQNLLNEIDDALKRIDDGTYGICEKYQTPISKARLKAMPYTRYCLKAQEEEEKNRPAHS